GVFGTGVTRTPKGKLGAGLSFGGGGMVSILNSPSLQLTTGMTLEAWVNPSYQAFEWRDIIYKANDNYWLMASSTHGSSPAGAGRFNGASSATIVDGPFALPA